MIGYPKTIVCKSFIGLTVKEFDNIYDKEIVKRYEKHELKRLSTKRKNILERRAESGRHIKLDVKNRFFNIIPTSICYRAFLSK